MSVDFGLLRTLHRMHRQLADIDERLRKGPLQVKIATQNEASFQTELEETKERQKQNRLATDRKQMTMNERDAKVADMESKLNTAASNKEFQLLTDRIAADKQASSVLADEIFEMLERQDAVDVEVVAATENYGKSKVEKKRIAEKVTGEMKALQAERERVAGELAEAEKKLPMDVRTDYRRRADAKGEDVLAETDAVTCGNCQVHLTAQMKATLLMSQILFCQGCGALYYLKEGVKA
jgi:predicted  nucleic acid-binding Zn-ribbon protein